MCAFDIAVAGVLLVADRIFLCGLIELGDDCIVWVDLHLTTKFEQINKHIRDFACDLIMVFGEWCCVVCQLFFHISLEMLEEFGSLDHYRFGKIGWLEIAPSLACIVKLIDTIDNIRKCFCLWWV